MAQYISKEGLEKLKEELEYRKDKVRPEIAEKISEAVGYGDLSENAEYTEAKELQAFNQGRIEELEDVVRNAIIIDPAVNNGKEITVGSTISVESKEHGLQEFTIVGASESSPIDGFISNESPLGRAFLGKKKGEEINIQIPVGTIKYKIKSLK